MIFKLFEANQAWWGLISLYIFLMFSWFCLIPRRPTSRFSGSRNFAQNVISWIAVRNHLAIIRMRKPAATTSSSALLKDLLQHLAICAIFAPIGNRSTKVDGGERCVPLPYKARHETFFSVRGTLQPLETSARLSQETRTES